MPVRTLLLTDLVDSTTLAERLGTDTAANLGARHDRVARDLLAQHGGREIDKTDGFLFLFEDPAAAADYALAYHRALEPLELHARAGLHTGEVALRENPPADVALGAKPLEVEGVGKALAARVMSLAQGGQTLATAATVEALGKGRVAVSHGHWRLKGVSEPVEVFELADTRDRAFPPPPDAAKAWRVVWQNDTWIPVRATKFSLSAERDAFVGRDPDLQELALRLDGGARLVTVLGIGGTGKTRLVLHFAWTWLGQWPGGAWFCDLSEARSPDGIVSAVARALDVPLGKDDPVVQLGHAIAGRGKCLVVLDNFEQVARLAPETLGRWLDRAKDAQFVVTTREVLGLPGEQALALAPLAEGDAVDLFVSRARSAKRDFALTEGERPHVHALVKLLDGLPLAIELAAARVRVMAPRTLRERMSQRFKLLASSGGRHTRQATLRATFDWSWELLSADEQQALAQLSVFEGGFALEAAESVLALHELWATDAVQGLVDKSWVRTVSADRFDLLVSVQEYATEKLDALGGRADAESRHGAYFSALGTEEALDALGVHGGTERRRALSMELDNAVAACRRAAARGDGPVAVATFLAAWSALELRGPFSVAAHLGAAVLGMDLTPEDDARASAARAGSVQLLGRMDEARALYEHVLAVHRESWPDRGHRRGEGVVLGNLGNLHRQQGRMGDAWALYEQTLAIHREVGDRRGEGVVLGNLGVLHLEQGRMDEARSLYEQALAVHREVGNRRVEGSGLGNLGSLHGRQGRMDEARALYEQALAVHREVGNRRAEGIGLGNLGILHQQQGRMDEARALYEQALAVSREVGDRRFEGTVLGNLGNLHMKPGRMDEARALYEQALAIHREIGNRGFESIVLGNLGRLHLEQGRMDEARALFADGERLLRDVGDPSELAKLLCGRACLEATLGHLDDARQLLAEAEALAVELRAGPESEVTKELARARAAVEGR